MLDQFGKSKLTSPAEDIFEMPLMGLGTFIGIEADRIESREERNQITTDSILNALATGYRHLDLAENYGNLEPVSAALKKACLPKSEGGLGIARKDIWLTMKANAPFSSEHIDSLLKAVGVKYFDLFLIHHSTSGIFNSENQLLDAWKNLCEIEKSKLHRIGVSNCYEPHLERLLAICDKNQLERPYANEVELNLLTKNNSLIAFCNMFDIKIIAYSPLCYHLAEVVTFKNRQLKALAEKIHATPAQAALARIMAKGIAVIPKSRQQAHLEENFAATKFIDSVKEQHELAAKLDIESGDDEGATMTSSDSKEHGKALNWDVTVAVSNRYKK